MIATFLLSLPFLLLLIALIGVVLFLRYGRDATQRDGSDDSSAILFNRPVQIQAEPDTPVGIGFGYKTLWFATRANSANAVAETMAMREVQPANWYSGIMASYENGVIFVTPPVKGWVMAVGRTLPYPDDLETQKWSELMTTLSQRFGVAHFYGSHRVSNYATWAIYEQGIERRVFACGDELVLNSGTPLPQEADRLRRIFTSDNRRPDDKIWFPDEDDVFELAGEWSVNPITLETLNVPPSVGLVGKLD